MSQKTKKVEEDVDLRFSDQLLVTTVMSSNSRKVLQFQLLFEDEFSRVEKIKVISSTYMAACGLQPGRKNSLEPALSSGSNTGIVDQEQQQHQALAVPRSSSSFAGAASAASAMSEATTGKELLN